jgi:hypothetical protein
MENAKVTFVSRQVMPGLSFVNFSPRRNWGGEELEADCCAGIYPQ